MYIMCILYISCAYYIIISCILCIYHVHNYSDTIHIMHHVPKAASRDYIVITDWAGIVQNMDSGRTADLGLDSVDVGNVASRL